MNKKTTNLSLAGSLFFLQETLELKHSLNKTTILLYYLGFSGFMRSKRKDGRYWKPLRKRQPYVSAFMVEICAVMPLFA
jgi:hypothetical protein